MANSSKYHQTAQSISYLIPRMVQGAQLGVFTNRSITQTQFLLLVCLHSKESCTMGEIASHMKVSMPTMTGVVNRLVQAKYLKRISHPQDRRAIRIELTPKAHQFLKLFQTTIAKRWEEVLQVLDETELDQMLKIVTKLNQAAMKGSK